MYTSFSVTANAPLDAVENVPSQFSGATTAARLRGTRHVLYSPLLKRGPCHRFHPENVCAAEAICVISLFFWLASQQRVDLIDRNIESEQKFPCYDTPKKLETEFIKDRDHIIKKKLKSRKSPPWRGSHSPLVTHETSRSGRAREAGHGSRLRERLHSRQPASPSAASLTDPRLKCWPCGPIEREAPHKLEKAPAARPAPSLFLP